MKYRPEIDGLRALAVIPVILFHAGFHTFGGGYIGVDVFFVISGYLITTIIASELDNKNFSVIAFYERRARRILPALFFVLIACLPFCWFWLLPEDLKSFSQSLIAVCTFSSNILFWRTSGYFDIATEMKPLLHTWSLAVEEQYYVVFPLILIWTWRLGRRKVVGLLALTFALSLAAAQWGSIAKPTASFYLLPTRGWELLIGTFASFLASSKFSDQLNRRVVGLAAALGISLILYSIFAFSDKTPFPGVYALAPTIGAAFVIVFADSGTIVGRCLANQVLVRVGLISYSAYLWHQPILAFARHRSLYDLSFSVVCLLVLLTFALAYLSWRFVELPWRNKRIFTRATVFRCGIATTIVLIGVGMAGQLADGFPGRVPSNAPWADLLKNPQEPMRNVQCDGAFPQFRDFSACLLSTNSSPEILIIGDSHSEQYFKSLSAALPDKAIMNLGLWNCLPFASQALLDTQPGCEEKLRLAHKFASHTSSIKVVILAGYWAYLSSGGFSINNHNFRLARHLEPTEAQSFLTSGTEFLKELGASDKRIIFMKDIPDLDFNISSCFAMHPFKVGQPRKSCSIDRSGYLQRNEDYFALVDELLSSFPQVEVYSPTELFCSASLCTAERDGFPLYFNSDHLTMKGSDMVMHDLLLKHPMN